MKEELQTKLVEILGSIQAAAGKAGDFALSQLPEIAQTYVLYGRVTGLVMLVLYVSLAGAAGFVAVRYGWANYGAVVKNKGSIFDGDWHGHRTAAAGFGSFACFLFTIFAMLRLSDCLLVWLAPKVWLIRELAIMAR